jgi:Fe-S oxidoreductase
VAQCPFLQKHGTPRAIAEAQLTGGDGNRTLAFECSLCSLCSAVCPEGLDPDKLFLDLRRTATATGETNFSPYRALLRHESLGGSRLLAYHGLPGGCRTVLFPGCALPGTRPEATWLLFWYLRRHIPDLGIVLDCCGKPSRDLGRTEAFEARFRKILNKLARSGVRKIVLACPNCFTIFKDSGELTVVTAYEIIAANGLPDEARTSTGKSPGLALHDPCPMRRETAVQDAVRTTLTDAGLAPTEMRHRRELTLCCGEGGAVEGAHPDLAKRWRRIRSREAGDNRLVTYCAGCAGYLEREHPTLHLLDLLFFPHRALAGELRPIRSPWTYFHRFLLKRRFKHAVESAANPRQVGSSTR